MCPVSVSVRAALARRRSNVHEVHNPIRGQKLLIFEGVRMNAHPQFRQAVRACQSFFTEISLYRTVKPQLTVVPTGTLRHDRGQETCTRHSRRGGERQIGPRKKNKDAAGSPLAPSVPRRVVNLRPSPKALDHSNSRTVPAQVKVRRTIESIPAASSADTAIRNRRKRPAAANLAPSTGVLGAWFCRFGARRVALSRRLLPFCDSLTRDASPMPRPTQRPHGLVRPR